MAGCLHVLPAPQILRQGACCTVTRARPCLAVTYLSSGACQALQSQNCTHPGAVLQGPLNLVSRLAVSRLTLSAPRPILLNAPFSRLSRACRQCSDASEDLGVVVMRVTCVG